MKPLVTRSLLPLLPHVPAPHFLSPGSGPGHTLALCGMLGPYMPWSDSFEKPLCREAAVELRTLTTSLTVSVPYLGRALPLCFLSATYCSVCYLTAPFLGSGTMPCSLSYP